MDLSPPRKRAKVAAERSRKKRPGKKTGPRSWRKSSRSTRRSENRPKGVPRVLFAAMIAIGSGRETRFDAVGSPEEPVADRAARKIAGDSCESDE